MRKCILSVLIALLLPGCGWINENFYDRLLFVEESHIGLKAKVGIDQTPGDVDFGYRRSVVALIPKANATAGEKKAGEPKATVTTDESTAQTDPDCPPTQVDSKQPLSVISSFNADVRWFESTRVSTYFATGKAAEQTACDLQAIKALVSITNE